MLHCFPRFAALAITFSIVYGSASKAPKSEIAPIFTSAPIASNVQSASSVSNLFSGNASDARIPCSPSSCSCASLGKKKRSRRGLADLASKLLGRSFSKRTLQTPFDYANDIVSFFLTQFYRPWTEKLDIRGTEESTTSTGCSRALGADPFNIALGGLWGCTSVVVVSKSAIWMSHFWEIPAFRSEASFDDGKRAHADIAKFNDMVLNEMQHEGTDITGLRLYTTPGASYSAAEDPQWIIVTPGDENRVEGKHTYEPEVLEIQRVLNDLFPNAPPRIVNYIPRGRLAQISYNVRGKVLVQYDPDQNVYRIPFRQNPIYQNAIVRMWFEQPVFEKKWRIK